jgi:4,5-DOPA dioxygenase extradiol
MTDNSIMPVLFIGHGSPINAIEKNEFSLYWKKLGEVIPRPKAILCISAHWETRGTMVTGMSNPRTIHDFGGFAQELYEVEYPAPGDTNLANRIVSLPGDQLISLNMDWGLDHGTWSVLNQMYPQADIPVIQLSLDIMKTGQDHYALGKILATLRQEGVLIIGSGNMVHNLGRVVLRRPDISSFNEPYGLPWALEASELFKKLILEERFEELADFRNLGEAAQLAIPTSEHYLPLLYILALKAPRESITFFNDKAVAGSLTMTSMIITSDSIEI